MSRRPTWQGHLKLSLVSCPVVLYAAASSAREAHFHLINPKTKNRIRMIATDPESGPVERRDLMRGFEIEKGQYVLLTDEEIKAVRLESTRTIEIERFVPADEIDRLYWNDPYFLLPDGAPAAEAYGVIREAMKKSGQIALGRVVMATRERLLAIEPRDGGLVAYTLRVADEVESAEEAFDDIPKVKPDPAMVEIALKIIEQKEQKFDPSKFVDRYEEALKALIAEKSKGHKPVAAEAPEDTNVVDLMAALRASLKGEGPTKSGARRAPAEKTRATSKARSKPAAHRRKAS